VWSQAGLDKKHEILSKNKLKAKRDQVVEPWVQTPVLPPKFLSCSPSSAQLIHTIHCEEAHGHGPKYWVFNLLSNSFFPSFGTGDGSRALHRLSGCSTSELLLALPNSPANCLFSSEPAPHDSNG
jgi:hypothetical protein